MRNVQYTSSPKASPWRKVSIGSWKPKGDSSIYAFEDFCVNDALDWCEQNKISFNTFIIKAFAKTISKQNKINSVVRFGKIHQRKHVRIFYHILPSLKTDDLSGILFHEPQHESVDIIEEQFRKEISTIRKGEDAYTKSKKTFKYIPGFLSRATLNLLSFVMYTLNIRPFFIPSEKDPFGSVMITHIGTLRLSKACTPIAPYTRIPMVIAVGKATEKPWVIDDEIVPRKVVTIGFTFDHRIMDGIHFASFIQELSTYFNHPNELQS